MQQQLSATCAFAESQVHLVETKMLEIGSLRNQTMVQQARIAELTEKVKEIQICLDADGIPDVPPAYNNNK